MSGWAVAWTGGRYSPTEREPRTAILRLLRMSPGMVKTTQRRGWEGEGGGGRREEWRAEEEGLITGPQMVATRDDLW